MTKEQGCKLSLLALTTSVILLMIEVIFANFTIEINSSDIWLTYLSIFILMFLQGTILPIPAIVVLQLSIKMGIDVLSIGYITTVILAYMSACILSYWIGRWFGTKALKWAAGNDSDYHKWCDILGNKGKWWYALTVLLPLFPDDLLSIVVGSVKMNFAFYTVVNFIGRTIGLITMLYTLIFIGSIGGNNSNLMLFVWVICIIASVISYFIFNNKK